MLASFDFGCLLATKIVAMPAFVCVALVPEVELEFVVYLAPAVSNLMDFVAVQYCT